MYRRQWFVVALVCFAIGATVLVGPAESTGCARGFPAELQPYDGRWLLLYGEGCDEGLYVYDSDQSNRKRIDIENRVTTKDEYANLVGFVPASDDGWWFVFDDGRAYRFSANLRFENSSIPIPVDSFEYPTGIAIDSAGRWWITTDAETSVFEPRANETIQTFDRGATDIVIGGHRVWFLEDRTKGGVIQEFVIVEGDDSLSLREQSTHELGPEVFRPTLFVHGTDENWWVYSEERSAFVYDTDWRYMGKRFPSGSLGWGSLWLAPALLVSLISAIAIEAAWGKHLPERYVALYFTMVGSAFALALAVRQSLLPYPASYFYWLPNKFAAGLLASLVFGEMALLEERSPVTVLFVIAANLPIFVIVWDFVTSVG